MSRVLVDSSAWIEYLGGSKKINNCDFDELIDNNQICTNDLILSELIPSLSLNKQSEVIDILKSIKNIPINIGWDEIINFQIINLKNGINKVGIPDLIILQNVLTNGLALYSLDRHFTLMNKIHKFELIC